MLHFVQRLLSDKAIVLSIRINSVKNNLYISTSMSYLYLYVCVLSPLNQNLSKGSPDDQFFFFFQSIFSDISADHSSLGTSDLKGINYSHRASEIITHFFLDSSVIPRSIHYSLMGKAEG